MPDDAAAGRLLVISGSTRSESTNSAFCRTVISFASGELIVDGVLDVAMLPHFNPDDDREPLPAAVQALRAAIAAADAVLFCTPEYAGTLPGSFKNLLDWTVGGTEMTDKPVAWVKVATDSRRGEGAHAALATVLGYVQAAVVEDACRHIPVTSELIGPDGLITDAATHRAIEDTIRALLPA
ncbi:NADPH-dependent FMN reductase [Williamsia sp. 1135]|uniref:NADPH-dependent FMN reductase n=1 Tax=Williamsia sp. 1135 TaxID=1889262 RepID=UPI000A106BCA|nr:NADPH-dependent FMN reductase [Williamsia sp. 1135]ORM36558.1 NADPH-dependent FMN reductase [Williamsia sp. 1135]